MSTEDNLDVFIHLVNKFHKEEMYTKVYDDLVNIYSSKRLIDYCYEVREQQGDDGGLEVGLFSRDYGAVQSPLWLYQVNTKGVQDKLMEFLFTKKVMKTLATQPYQGG